MDLISDIGKQKIREVYRDVCIAENAFRNDVGKPNGNYDQRKIAIDDVFLALGMIGDAREIEDEVNGQVWTRTISEHGTIRYTLVE